MLYDRKIKYLDYYEGGIKVNGGGFAKLEVRDNTMRLEVAIRGLHPTDSFERDVVLQGVEKEGTLGQIRIQNGCGQFRYSCNVDQEIGVTGISYSDLRGIRISIGGTREILCQWGNVSDKRRITPPEENIQKSKSGLQESKGDSITEIHTDSKANPEAPVYIESERIRDSGLEKTKNADEEREAGKKEGHEGIENKDRKEENRAAIDRESKGVNNIEDNNIEDKNKEGKEDKNRENKDKDVIEDKDRENKDRERQEGKNREDKDRERQEGKDGEDKDREGQELKENKEVKEDTKKDIEKKEKAALHSEERSGDLDKDKSDRIGNNREEQPDERKAPVKLMEDKWQQLSAIYPHIQPFRDERDYLSLTPSDFVLFPDRFYRAVNNSFLLHGYYNYHHLILARMERRGEIIYYIGVPGNYFEREKQVAIMFGFESFECETEPARTGDFGYYMMRTEL